MNNTHLVDVRPTDYLLGVSSPIVFKAVSNDWSKHLQFFERQKIQFETDGCEFFTGQESFDAQVDALIENGTIPQSIVNKFTAMGFMDMSQIDNKVHFHSSPRFLQICSGVGKQGASIPTVWDIIRHYGCIPWQDLPFTETTMEDAYFAPIPQNLLGKGLQFLALIGGKEAVQYHWVMQGSPKNIPLMQTQLQQAPLCLGVATIADFSDTGGNPGWNQITPTDPPVGARPGHAVMCYAVQPPNILIFDHYTPFKKILDAGYEDNYALQGVVSPIVVTPPVPVVAPVPVPVVAPVPVPVLPQKPTVAQQQAWFVQLKVWLTNILITMQKGRK